MGVPWGHFTLPCQPLKQTVSLLGGHFTLVSECVLVFVCVTKKRRLPKLVQGVQVQAATCQRFMVELAGGFTIHNCINYSYMCSFVLGSMEVDVDGQIVIIISVIGLWSQHRALSHQDHT